MVFHSLPYLVTILPAIRLFPIAYTAPASADHVGVEALSNQDETISILHLSTPPGPPPKEQGNIHIWFTVIQH